MMKYVKAFGIVIVVVGLAAGVIWQFWGKDLKAQADIGAAFAAKHVCSCLHVAERTMESCSNDFVDQTMTTVSRSKMIGGTTHGHRAVRACASATARFEPGLGCALVEN